MSRGAAGGHQFLCRRNDASHSAAELMPGWGGGAPAPQARACVLCRAPAALYCRNDDAFLCSSCDLQVHGCSALLAGHDRMPCAALAAAAASCDSGSAATASALDRWGLPFWRLLSWGRRDIKRPGRARVRRETHAAGQAPTRLASPLLVFKA